MTFPTKRKALASTLLRTHVIAFALVMSFGLASHAQAEGDADSRGGVTTAEAPAWTVQVDYLTTALGFVHVLLEKRVAKQLSVYAGPHARVFRGIILEDEDYNTGYGVEFGARYFPLKRDLAPSGLWIQARVVAARITAGDVSGLGGYVSAIGGYSLILSDRWVIAGGLGVQYMHYNVNDIGPKGVIPAAHTAVGVAF